MSQGRGAIENRNDIGTGLRPAGVLRNMVRNGVSFSGRERNCCFVNLQDGNFGNISVASGLDFPDDGRGIATVDWDQDGDLDVWLVNRSGPQVRFMRNEQANPSQFVSFKLHGRSGNRDAIGARVELKLKGEPTSQIQTVRAGNAYLSQSSKWMHFGTGENDQIEFVRIDWPGRQGTEQIIRVPRAGTRYHITEGDERPRESNIKLTVGAKSGKSKLRSESTQSAFSDAAPNRILLTTPVPLPPLYARTLDASGTQTNVTQSGHATLVNLWATWCQPCILELANFGERYEELQSAGISVVAAAVDNVDISRAVDPRALAISLRECQSKFHFNVVQADRLLLGQLQSAHDNLLDLHDSLPIPSSFLLDGSGQLLAIYKGPISVDQLVRDTTATNRSPTKRRDIALPFTGKWSGAPRNPRLLKLTLDMLPFSDPEGMKDFVKRNQTELAQDSAYAVLLFNMGQQHTRRGEHNQAVEFYKQALRHRPTMASAYYNLGITYAGTKQFDTALVCFEQAEKNEPGRLDTRLALARTLTNLDRKAEAASILEDTVRIHPLSRSLQFELAIALAATGRVQNAIDKFSNAAQSTPEAKQRYLPRFKSAVDIGLASVNKSSAAELRRSADLILRD